MSDYQMTNNTPVPSETKLRRARSRVRVFDPTNPAHLYLNSIGTNSAKTMERCLDAIANLLKSHIFEDSELRSVVQKDNVYMDDIDWTVLKRHHVQAVMRMLETQQKAPSTMATYLAAIKGVIKEAYMAEPPLISLERYDRIKNIKPPKGKRDRTGQAIDLEIVAKAIRSCLDNTLAGIRDKAIISVLLGAGLRRAECASLKYEDMLKNPDRLHIIGKGNKQRIIPIEPAVVEAIAQWLYFRGVEPGPLFYQIGKARKPKDGTLYKGKMKTEGLSEQGVYYICQKRGVVLDEGDNKVNILKPHNLRRTYGTVLDKTGVDLATICELLGHSNLITTQTYIFDDKEIKKQEAVNSAQPLSKTLNAG